MHIVLIGAPNRAIPIKGIFHARLEPLRAFVSSYPMDGILRASEKCCRPISGILSDTTSDFTDQPRLCYRKHSSLHHHLCFRAVINLQSRIRRPRFSSSRATGTHVAPTADNKCTALLSTPFDPSANFFARPSAKNFPFLLDLDLRETLFRD